MRSPPFYLGLGICSEPYLVDWVLNDPDDPYNWPRTRKWAITAQLAVTTFTVAFGSSVYAGGLKYVVHDLGVSEELAILGISLYVLGFALGYVFYGRNRHRSCFSDLSSLRP